MNRPLWHEIHMKQAELIAQRSTCIKRRVGAVLVKDNRTISQGYNGVGPGCKHCYDHWYDLFIFYSQFNNTEIEIKEIASCETFNDFIKSKYFRSEHKIWTINNELHAEQNCILWAAREGIPTKDSILYTVYSPCINCAKVIHMAGIKAIYYQKIYESDQLGVNYLHNNSIICEQI